MMYVIPVSKATDAPSKYSKRDQCERRLEELPSPWWTYIEQIEVAADIDMDMVGEEEVI